MSADGNAARPVLPKRIGVVVVHGNGEVEPGWINKYLLERLRERLLTTGRPDAVAIDPDSRVYDLPDAITFEDDGEATFPAFVRHARLASGPEVVFAELYWCDLSRITAEPIVQFFAALRLFYEAPAVLVKRFFPAAASPAHRALRWLLQIAIWIIRWLVAGLNGTLFIGWLAVSTIIMLSRPASEILKGTAGIALPDVAWGAGLGWLLVVVLGLLATGSAWLALRRDDQDIGLTDVWIATSIASALGLGGVLVLQMLHAAPERLSGYVGPLLYLNFGIGVTWDAIAIAAVLIFAGIALARTVHKPADGAPPLYRLGAALALTILQAQVWKICVPAAAAITITLFDKDHMLDDQYVGLTSVGVLNSFLTALLLLLALVLLNVGGWIRYFVGGSIARADPLVPRVVISWTMVALLALGPFAGLYEFYLVSMDGELGRTGFEAVCGTDVRTCVARSPWLHLFIAIVGLTVLGLLAFGRLQTFALAVLHFGRDIVDHQYKPDHLLARQAEARRTPAGATFNPDDFPRRRRIRRRLETLLTEVVGKTDFDRIIFVAHSQGSVIVHDALHALAGSAAKSVLGPIEEMHVVTLGSPITHLYQHYFQDYADAGADQGWLPHNLYSWSNLWRIDDPVADEVLLWKDFVANKPLDVGGHYDYWKEPEVCDVIITLLELPMVTAEVPPSSRPPSLPPAA